MTFRPAPGPAGSLATPMADDDEAVLDAARDRHPAAAAPITRSDQLGPAARPVSVPDDMSGPKGALRIRTADTPAEAGLDLLL
jgi:hypothetical protein